MPKAKCPQCATVVTYTAGYDPICPNCGFRGEAPPLPVPPTPPAAWSHVPTAGPPPAQTPGFSSPPPYASPQRRQSSGLATASLVLGIIAVVMMWVPFLGGLLGVLAAVLGGVGLGHQTPDGRPDPGRGMAIAGLVMGTVALLFNLVFWGAIMGWDEGW